MGLFENGWCSLILLTLGATLCARAPGHAALWVGWWDGDQGTSSKVRTGTLLGER